MGKVMMSQLASVLMEKHGLDKRTAQRFLSAVVEVIQYAITTDRQVKIKGLGTYKIIEVGARESVNVNTGERVVIEGHSKLTFTPDSAMKELVNKPFSQFETVILNEGVEFDDMPQDEAESASDGVVATTVEDSLLEQAAQVSGVVADNESADEMAQVSEEGMLQGAVSSEPEDNVSERTDANQLTPESSKDGVADAAADGMAESEGELSPEREASAADSSPEVLEDTAGVSQEDTVGEEDEAVDDEGDDASSATDAGESRQQGKAAQNAMLEQNDERLADRQQADGRRYFPWLWVLACLLSGVFGYMLGRSAVGHSEEDTVKPDVAAKVAVDSAAVAERLDTASVATGAEELAKSNPVRTVSVDVQPDSDGYKKYEAMDARVRLGAYRIVGVQEIAKARAGESVKQISHRYLGPDMECYVEVLNGLKATDVLKAGQDVKIPKLEWKKNLRKNRK